MVFFSTFLTSLLRLSKTKSVQSSHKGCSTSELPDIKSKIEAAFCHQKFLFSSFEFKTKITINQKSKV